MHYLDHNATSPLRPEARAAVERALDVGGNPSSVHARGRAAREIVEGAREQVAVLAGADPADVIFTSGGTEANTLALCGAVAGAAEAGGRLTRLFVSAIEHDSILANATALAERAAGLRVEIIPVAPDGMIDLAALRVQLREGKGRALIAAMAANNETGVIQPIAEIASLTKEHGALLLIDAIQAAGKIALDYPYADYLTLSAHKIGGPQGVGALIAKRDAPLSAQILGGGQERGRRAGTENLSGIAGFGAAAKAARNFDAPQVAALRDHFESRLPKEAIIFGANVPRLANTSNFALPGLAAETAIIALDLDGVTVSSGAACSSGKVKSSHVLKAMGVADELASCALRVSFGWNSAEEDVYAAIASLQKLHSRIRARAAA
ncbi:MAG TPA: cysteine desulfurase family protein [Rhizomicrobium sp.]|jgi:cysteine desulfurase|nr:cysteine desulfurase family protein [Rhizomicrobium sp.]